MMSAGLGLQSMVTVPSAAAVTSTATGTTRLGVCGMVVPLIRAFALPPPVAPARVVVEDRRRRGADMSCARLYRPRHAHLERCQAADRVAQVAPSPLEQAVRRLDAR